MNGSNTFVLVVVASKWMRVSKTQTNKRKEKAKKEREELSERETLYLRLLVANQHHSLVNWRLVDMDHEHNVKWPIVAHDEYHIHLNHALESNMLQLVDQQWLRNRIFHLNRVIAAQSNRNKRQKRWRKKKKYTKINIISRLEMFYI